MTALDPDLSAAPLTVKMDFRVRNLETLRKLQQKISSSDGFQMLHRVGQPSHQRPPSNVFRCFGVNKHLHLHGARPIGVWRACVGDIRLRRHSACNDVAWRCSWSFSTSAKFRPALKRTFARQNHVLALSG